MTRDGFPDTLPMLQLAEAEAQRFRDHDGEIDDEHDAARDVEAEEGRDIPRLPRRGWAALLLAALALLAAGFMTAHPCDIDGRHDSTCGVVK